MTTARSGAKKAAAKSGRRQALGDALDLVVPGAPGARTEAPAAEAARPKLAPVRERVAKVRATFHIPEDLFSECRDAVVHLSGPPYRLTLAQLAEDALRHELDRLRKKANDGQPFPKRAGELRGGRPIGS